MIFFRLGFEVVYLLVVVVAVGIAVDRANAEISLLVVGDFVVARLLLSVQVFGIFGRPVCFFSFHRNALA